MTLENYNNNEHVEETAITNNEQQELAIVGEIIKTQKFIQALEKMTGGDESAVARRMKDIEEARNTLDDLQKKKQEYLDKKYDITTPAQEEDPFDAFDRAFGSTTHEGAALNRLDARKRVSGIE